MTPSSSGALRHCHLPLKGKDMRAIVGAIPPGTGRVVGAADRVGTFRRLRRNRRGPKASRFCVGDGPGCQPALRPTTHPQPPGSGRDLMEQIMAKKLAGYIEKSDDSAQSCGSCHFYLAPFDCIVVEGPVSPWGYCNYYAD